MSDNEPDLIPDRAMPAPEAGPTAPGDPQPTDPAPDERIGREPAGSTRPLVYLVPASSNLGDQLRPNETTATAGQQIAGPEQASTAGTAAGSERPTGTGLLTEELDDPERDDAELHDAELHDAELDDAELDDDDLESEESAHADWAWVEQWRAEREPTPWATGVVLTAFTALVVGVAIWVLCAGLADRPVVAVLVNLLVAGGLAPAMWLTRGLPVLRWIAAGALVGVIGGWISAILMLPMPLP